MRIVVVLPLPLGPRKPKIVAALDANREVVDDGATAIALGQPVHVDGGAARASCSRLGCALRCGRGLPRRPSPRAGRQRHFDRQPRMQRRIRRGRPRLDQEHEVRAILPAVDHRRRELRLRRDEAYASPRCRRRSRRSARSPRRPCAACPRVGLRHVEADLDVRRRQAAKRPARRPATHSPGRYSVSTTRPAAGAPCDFCATRHCACASASLAAFTSASRAAISSLRAGRLAICTCWFSSATRARSRSRVASASSRRCGGRNLSATSFSVRMRSASLWRSDACACASCARTAAISGGRRAFSRFASERLRLAHARFCLGARRALLLAFEREQRRIERDLRAALDRQLQQRSGQRRRHAHVFALDVTGKARRRALAATDECERARERRQARGHRRRCSMGAS